MRLFYILAILAFIATTAKAETLAEFVERQQAAGLTSARQVRQAMLEQSTTVTVTNKVRAARAQEKALEAVIVPAILTKPQLSAIAPENRMESVTRRFATRLQAATTDADKAAIRAAWADFQILSASIQAQGGDPLGPRAGTDTESEQVTTRGMTWWDINKPVGHIGPPPDIDQIRELMR